MRKKRKTSLWLPIGGVIALVAVLFAVWPIQKPPTEQERFRLDKTGAGTSADYTAACNALHAAIDSVLAKERVNVKEKLEIPRIVPRIQAEGDIRWHTRHLLIEKPNSMSLDTLVKSIESSLSPANGKLLAAQADFFQGFKVHRIDIGFEDKLGGEPITIIADKVFIITNANAAVPPAKTQAKADLAIIIDDFGYSAEPISAFTSIKQALTFSVLPHRPYTNEAAANALSSGHQVMLHLPMEPLSVTNDREELMISPGMRDEQIKTIVVNALASVPGSVGVNNHQGSKATADYKTMRAVMTVLKPKSLYFVDSRTTTASVAAEAARQAGIRTAENRLFLDNNPEVSAIKEQLRLAITLALKQGKIIVIGHARPTTAVAIQEMLPEFKTAGIRLVFASEIVK